MRIFVDMDGTLAKWNNVEFEQLFEEGYYRNLEPNKKLLDEVNNLISQGEDIYILSAYLTESNYAKKEKEEWVKQYLPELPKEKQIFVPYGTNKAEYLKEHYSPITNQDYLIDDYTKNLLEWKEFGGIGVKYLNGINHTKGTWQGLIINGKEKGIIEQQDNSLYGLLLSEKLKLFNMNLIASAVSTSEWLKKGGNDYRACQVHYKGKSHYFQYPIDKGNKNIEIEIIKIIKIIEETSKEHMIFNIDTEPLLIDVSSNYYSRHYPTLSKCKDFDIICKKLSANVLDDMEYTIFLWEYTDYVKVNTETNELYFTVDENNKLYCNSDFIAWYTGWVTTEDLINEIQLNTIVNNNNINNCEAMKKVMDFITDEELEEKLNDEQNLDEPDICDY